MVTRAPRFTIHAPLHYRPSGGAVWHKGRTENISRSGMLFRVAQLMEVDTPIEMTFVLPVEVGGEAGTEVVCQGQIIRKVLPSAPDVAAILAARISDYRLVRGKGASVG